jgi:hypothetical protein
MDLNKSMLTEYQDRWKAVANVEKIEQQQTSVAQRWRKLNALVRMAAGLGLLQKEDDDTQISEVRERWNRLKQLHAAKSQRQIA